MFFLEIEFTDLSEIRVPIFHSTKFPLIFRNFCYFFPTFGNAECSSFIFLWVLGSGGSKVPFSSVCRNPANLDIQISGLYISGGSRISQTGDANTNGRCQPIIWPNFAKTYMKNEDNWRGWGASKILLCRSATVYTLNLEYVLFLK